MAQVFVKDPEAVLDYKVDWTAWLAGDTISSSTWTVPDGLTTDSSDETTTTATIWLSGGTHQQDYTVINTITTAAGRTDQRRIRIEVRDR